MYIYFFLGYLGLEPRANRLKAEYSTIELATLYILNFTLLVIINLLIFLYIPKDTVILTIKIVIEF